MGALKGGEQGLIFDAAMRYFAAGTPTGGQVDVRATSTDGKVTEFKADVRIDTPAEAEYYRHGGILHYVLRRLVKA